MDLERLSAKTADDLTAARAADFVRLIALETQFRGDPNAGTLARRNFPVRYPGSVNKYLFEKSAVAAGTMLDSTWAAPTSPLRPLADAFLTLLRPQTLIGRIPGLRSVPFQVSVPLQTAGGTYGWIGEGAPTSVTKSDFSTVSLGRAKAGGIVAISEELAALSSPSAVAVMRDELVKGCAQFLDTQFVDPTVAVSANISPASITNGAGTTASAGTSQANAATDWQVLITTFIAANPHVEDLVVLMKPANAVALSRALNQPTLGLRGGTAHGIPVVTSASVGNLLVALDASRILIADEGDVEISVSNSALVQLDTAATDPTVAATIMTSLFQRNLVGIKIVRAINWIRAQTVAVHYISAAAYV